MNRTKQLPSDLMETPLNRCLNTFDITLLGKINSLNMQPTIQQI